MTIISPQTREGGKTMLREIANRRQHTEQNTVSAVKLISVF